MFAFWCVCGCPPPFSSTVPSFRESDGLNRIDRAAHLCRAEMHDVCAAFEPGRVPLLAPFPLSSVALSSSYPSQQRKIPCYLDINNGARFFNFGLIFCNSRPQKSEIVPFFLFGDKFFIARIECTHHVGPPSLRAFLTSLVARALCALLFLRTSPRGGRVRAVM